MIQAGMPGITLKSQGPIRKGALRKANDRLLLDIIRRTPGISRTELSRLTGSASSSITLIINRLVQARLLTEEPVKRRPKLGRRPTSLRLDYNHIMAVAVDISPSGPRIALVDLSGKIIREQRLPWNNQTGVLVTQIHSAIRSLLRQAAPAQVLGVGVSVPGSLETSTGRVIASVNLNWYDMDLGGMLRGDLSLPFHYQNNANLCALAEQWFIDPQSNPLRDFVYVLAVDGLGTGITVNGHLLQGASAVGGEFGHTILYPDGLPCPCGNHGCWEQYASERALIRIYRELSESSNGHSSSGILQLAQRNDPAALGALRQTASDLGLGFLNVISVFDPEAIIVGGYLKEAWDLIEDQVWHVLRSRAPHYALNRLRIFPARHGADSTILGAAALAFHHFFTTFDSGLKAQSPPAPVTMQVTG
jgi:predicted NBD/HSP70 family sugar kinase